MHYETGGILCIKEVIVIKQQDASDWVVALDMYIYRCVNSWFEYDGLSWKIYTTPTTILEDYSKLFFEGETMIFKFQACTISTLLNINLVNNKD